MARLSKAVVDEAQPGAADVYVWDSSLKGFGLKVTPKGHKVYLVKYRVAEHGKPLRDVTPRRYTIGAHGSPWTPATAREKAENLLRQVADGIDPIEAEKAELAAVAKREAEVEARSKQAFEVVLANYAAGPLATQARGKVAEATIRNAFSDRWRGRDVATITRADVNSVIREMSPGAAREALKRVRPLFAYAINRDDIILNANPAENITVEEKYIPGERVLDDSELREVWQVADGAGYPFGPMVKSLILTGQRLREVAEARWSEFDFVAGTWTIPKERSKNRKAHVVHLSPQVRAIVEALPKMAMPGSLDHSPYLFTTTGRTPVSGFSRAKETFDRAIAKARKAARGANAPDMEEWTFHDLRRSFATGGAKAKIEMHVIERCMNHVPKAVQGVARIYQRFEFLDERKAAMDTWGAAVEKILTA